MTLPVDAQERKAVPMFSGLLKYFPDALAAVAHVSKVGNDQHNPGQPLHWARGKSTDHHDSLLRHLVDAGKVDSDGVRHSAKVAWRALAALQEEIELAEKQAIVSKANTRAVVGDASQLGQYRKAAEGQKQNVRRERAGDPYPDRPGPYEAPYPRRTEPAPSMPDPRYPHHQGRDVQPMNDNDLNREAAVGAKADFEYRYTGPEGTGADR